MSLEFEIPLVSLVFITILNITYFTKQRVNLAQNIPYKVILICSLIESLIDTIIHFICAMNSYDVIVSTYYPFFNYLNKILSSLFSIIFSSLFCYTMMITYPKIRNNPKKLINILVIVNFIFFIVMLFTNIELVDAGMVTNVTGLTAILGYVMVAIMLGSSLIVALLNIKRLDKRYLPIFSVFFALVILYSLTLLFPGMIIYDFILALICYIMYFTIENPDKKALEEVHRAKEISDNSNEEKMMFLYNMTNEIRDITRDINLSCDSILDEIDNNEVSLCDVENSTKDIKNSTAKFTTMTNEILDISTIDSQNIKIYNDKYNIKLILKQLITIYKDKASRKGISFRAEIASDIPEYLYGDSASVKSVLTTILDNAFKYTENGYIEFRVDIIIKKDICRLLMAVEDSGIGMKAESIENLFNKHKEEIEKNNLKNNLYTARKVITLMGGALIPSSTYGNGTTMKIVLDQKIFYEESGLEKYESVYDKKRILVVDDNEASIKIINKCLSGTNIKVDSVLLGKEALDKIRNKEKYDLILIDDDMKPLSGIEVMRKFKMIRTFNTKVILLSKKTEYEYSSEYLKEGFSDVVLKPISKDKLLEKLDKYLK